MTDQRAAKLVADFEQQLAREYSFDEQEVWAEALRVASEAVRHAKAKVLDRSRELGM